MAYTGSSHLRRTVFARMNPPERMSNAGVNPSEIISNAGVNPPEGMSFKVMHPHGRISCEKSNLANRVQYPRTHEDGQMPYFGVNPAEGMARNGETQLSYLTMTQTADYQQNSNTGRFDEELVQNFLMSDPQRAWTDQLQSIVPEVKVNHPCNKDGMGQHDILKDIYGEECGIHGAPEEAGVIREPALSGNTLDSYLTADTNNIIPDFNSSQPMVNEPQVITNMNSQCFQLNKGSKINSNPPDLILSATMDKERVASQTANVGVSCPECTRIFPNQRDRDKHFRDIHGDVKMPLHCQVCGRGYFDTAVLLKHYRRSHPAMYKLLYESVDMAIEQKEKQMAEMEHQQLEADRSHEDENEQIRYTRLVERYQHTMVSEIEEAKTHQHDAGCHTQIKRSQPQGIDPQTRHLHTAGIGEAKVSMVTCALSQVDIVDDIKTEDLSEITAVEMYPECTRSSCITEAATENISPVLAFEKSGQLPEISDTDPIICHNSGRLSQEPAVVRCAADDLRVSDVFSLRDRDLTSTTKAAPAVANCRISHCKKCQSVYHPLEFPKHQCPLKGRKRKVGICDKKSNSKNRDGKNSSISTDEKLPAKKRKLMLNIAKSSFKKALLQCLICRIECNSKSAYNKHIRNVHSLGHKTDETIAPSPLARASSKNEIDKSKHLFRCGICNLRYLARNQKWHMKKIHGVTPKQESLPILRSIVKYKKHKRCKTLGGRMDLFFNQGKFLIEERFGWCPVCEQDFLSVTERRKHTLLKHSLSRHLLRRKNAPFIAGIMATVDGKDFFFVNAKKDGTAWFINTVYLPCNSLISILRSKSESSRSHAAHKARLEALFGQCKSVFQSSLRPGQVSTDFTVLSCAKVGGKKVGGAGMGGAKVGYGDHGVAQKEGAHKPVFLQNSASSHTLKEAQPKWSSKPSQDLLSHQQQTTCSSESNEPHLDQVEWSSITIETTSDSESLAFETPSQDDNSLKDSAQLSQSCPDSSTVGNLAGAKPPALIPEEIKSFTDGKIVRGTMASPTVSTDLEKPALKITILDHPVSTEQEALWISQVKENITGACPSHVNINDGDANGNHSNDEGSQPSVSSVSQNREIILVDSDDDMTGSSHAGIVTSELKNGVENASPIAQDESIVRNDGQSLYDSSNVQNSLVNLHDSSGNAQVNVHEGTLKMPYNLLDNSESVQEIPPSVQKNCKSVQDNFPSVQKNSPNMQSNSPTQEIEKNDSSKVQDYSRNFDNAVDGGPETSEEGSSISHDLSESVVGKSANHTDIPTSVKDLSGGVIVSSGNAYRNNSGGVEKDSIPDFKALSGKNGAPVKAALPVHKIVHNDLSGNIILLSPNSKNAKAYRAISGPNGKKILVPYNLKNSVGSRSCRVMVCNKDRLIQNKTMTGGNLCKRSIGRDIPKELILDKTMTGGNLCKMSIGRDTPKELILDKTMTGGNLCKRSIGRDIPKELILDKTMTGGNLCKMSIGRDTPKELILDKTMTGGNLCKMSIGRDTPKELILDKTMTGGNLCKRSIGRDIPKELILDKTMTGGNLCKMSIGRDTPKELILDKTMTGGNLCKMSIGRDTPKELILDKTMTGGNLCKMSIGRDIPKELILDKTMTGGNLCKRSIGRDIPKELILDKTMTGGNLCKRIIGRDIPKELILDKLTESQILPDSSTTCQTLPQQDSDDVPKSPTVPLLASLLKGKTLISLRNDDLLGVRNHTVDTRADHLEPCRKQPQVYQTLPEGLQFAVRIWNSPINYIRIFHSYHKPFENEDEK